MKLNIGCGTKKLDGFVNIDKSALVEPDKVLDVEEGLPFADGCVTEIYSSHTLEHITPISWRFVLDEMVRVSADGAIWNLILPTDNHWARTNIDHFRTFGFTSFAQFTPYTNRAYYSSWKLVDLTKYPNRVTRAFHVLTGFIFCKEIHFTFKVLK